LKTDRFLRSNQSRATRDGVVRGQHQNSFRCQLSCGECAVCANECRTHLRPIRPVKIQSNIPVLSKYFSRWPYVVRSIDAKCAGADNVFVSEVSLSDRT